MKATSTAVVLALVGVLAVFGRRRCLAVPVNALTNNPFADIAARNVFGLKDPPPPPSAQQAQKMPLNIKLSGFVKHAAQPMRVLLASVPKDPKQQMTFYNLGVGETEDGVRLVKIHPGEDAVDVVIDGVPEELTVKSNSLLTGLYGKNTAPQRPGPIPAAAMRRWPGR